MTKMVQARVGAFIGAAALAGNSAYAQTAAEAALADLRAGGEYLSGDFHNHTTCTDGSMSVQTTVNESLVSFDLDWFSQTGHGGSGNRDCRFDDGFVGEQTRFGIDIDGDGQAGDADDFPYRSTVTWEDTIGLDGIKGRDNGNRMWRWQSLIEYAFPLQETMGELTGKPVWLGLEHIAPGHEHVSMAILRNQFRGGNSNAYHMGQFEYLWDRADDDTSGGEELDFENPANLGVAKEQDDAIRNASETGLAGQARAVESVEWMRDNFRPEEVYYVPAHVERQGAFVTTENRGWNVENFRELHNAGQLPQDQGLPLWERTSLVFGAEMLAGHQFFNGGRGTYEADRPTAGIGTYGGAGAYSGAVVSLPGKDFDGNDLVGDRLAAVGAEIDAPFEGLFTEPSGSDSYDALVLSRPQERYVLGRPGINTMWDAMLSEGRRFYNFGSSDWHNRGQFGPFEPQSTLDPWPGEYNKVWVYANPSRDRNREISQNLVINMREGNTWSSMGDIVDEFYFTICQGDNCAVMGAPIDVKAGEALTLRVEMRDPEGFNNSPYTFDNPSLLQIGINEPINEPVLKHIDIIRGDITGEIAPDSSEFSSNVANPTTEIYARVLREEMTETEGGYLSAELTIPAEEVTGPMYFRVRGTNIPVGTPFETDADGNPLLDFFSLYIECPFERDPEGADFQDDACPDHLPVNGDGVKVLDADVEAWADLWFYGNPIFVDAR